MPMVQDKKMRAKDTHRRSWTCPTDHVVSFVVSFLACSFSQELHTMFMFPFTSGVSAGNNVISKLTAFKL